MVKSRGRGKGRGRKSQKKVSKERAGALSKSDIQGFKYGFDPTKSDDADRIAAEQRAKALEKNAFMGFRGTGYGGNTPLGWGQDKGPTSRSWTGRYASLTNQTPRGAREPVAGKRKRKSSRRGKKGRKGSKKNNGNN